MQKLFLFVAIISFCACTKTDTNYSAGSSKRQFFKSSEEAFNIVKEQLQKFHSDENLKTIDRISYLYSGTKAYAFVFYSSNRGSSNLVLNKDYGADDSIGYTVTKCNGESCNCYVNAVISNDGNISVSCSCTSCTMTINQGLQ